MRSLPLLGFAELDAPLARVNDRLITRAEFIADVSQVTSRFPEAQYVVNLCQDRYAFMVCFAAACLRAQTNLLPANQTSGALEQIRADYPNHHVVDDSTINAFRAHASTTATTNVPTIPADHIAAICFTSGSTGQPQAHPSSWFTLVSSARRSAAGIFTSTPLNIVGTVPPQHMFGLETTILQPLCNNVSVASGKPFFPADVRDALEKAPAPRALITTPAHLRACLAAGLPMPELSFVLSATAPMPNELAMQTEEQWQTRVLEIYGSTETGAMAQRRTTEGIEWTTLPGGMIDIAETNAQFTAQDGAHAIALHDILQRVDQRRFKLLGRNADLIKVAGKRASLSELNSRLLAIPGVKDGVIFQPADDQRVAALVVLQDISERDVLHALGRFVDEVFLPRPLRSVPTLPRDAVGKLPRAALLAALDVNTKQQ